MFFEILKVFRAFGSHYNTYITIPLVFDNTFLSFIDRHSHIHRCINTKQKHNSKYNGLFVCSYFYLTLFYPFENMTIKNNFLFQIKMF